MASSTAIASTARLAAWRANQGTTCKGPLKSFAKMIPGKEENQFVQVGVTGIFSFFFNTHFIRAPMKDVVAAAQD